MFYGSAHSVFLGPEKSLADLLGFFIGVGHQSPHLVPKMLRSGNETHFLSGVDVDFFKLLGQADQGAQVDINILVFGGPDDAFRAAASGKPRRTIMSLWKFLFLCPIPPA